MTTATCDRCGAYGPGRYCPECGLDRDPASPTLSQNNAASAGRREGQWLQLHPDERPRVKTCPDCAEQVQGAAKLCRFCGYGFDGRRSAPQAGASTTVAAHAPSRLEEKSPAVAGWLAFLVSGLGHLYSGEGGRAALLFAGAVAAAIGSAFAGPVVLALLGIYVFGIIDARRAVEHRNRNAAARPLSGGIWAVTAVAAIAFAIGMAQWGSGAETSSIADQIKPDLESQLQSQVVDAEVIVGAVSCVSASSGGGSCLADVSDSLGNQQKVSIDYTVDSTTGETLWQTNP